ncbi:MAG TPA: hypothetical protein VIK14_12380 [Ignavibacteria bacterium]
MEAKNIKIKETFDYLYLCEKQLTPSQLEFIRSVKKQFARTKELSEKQMKILIEIKKYLPAQEVRFSGQLKQCSGQLETVKRINIIN